MIDLKEETIEQLVQLYLKVCLDNEGAWVDLNKITYAETVWNRLRDLLKLMGIKYAIPSQFPSGEIVYDDHAGYKIKVLNTKQKEDSFTNASFSVRYGYKPPPIEQVIYETEEQRLIRAQVLGSTEVTPEESGLHDKSH